jgi:nucleoside-diphosphate-sugar epimerase
MTLKIYLTGCTGQVGSRLTSLLLKQGHQVFGVRNSKDCKNKHINHVCRKVNLLDSSEDFYLQTFLPDVLVHTAWTTTPNEFWSSNRNKEWLNVSKRLIKEFEIVGGKYLVVTGSCAEYSWETDVALREDSIEVPDSLYGKSKLELLNWLRERDLPFLWTRTFFQFGMNEPSGRFIPSAIDSLLVGKKLEVRNAADIRDFVFIEDVSKILAQLIEDKTTGVINVGSGIETSVEQVLQVLSDRIGPLNNFQIKRDVESRSFVVADASRLHSKIRNITWTPLDVSLAKTIEMRGMNLEQSHKPV